MSETPAMSASGFPGKRVEAHRAGIRITADMDASDDNNRRVAGSGWRVGPPATRQMLPADRELARRLTIAMLALFAVVAAYSKLDLLYSHKFFDNTGRAQWIWA